MVLLRAKDLFVFTSERQPKTIFVNCSASLIKDFTLATLHVKRCDGHGALWKACDPVDSADLQMPPSVDDSLMQAGCLTV
jgi:hypothetical protein